MGNYITDAYARVQCANCGNKVVDILKPGTPFDSIKPCPCEEEVVLKKLDIDEVRRQLTVKGIQFSPLAKLGSLLKKLEES